MIRRVSIALVHAPVLGKGGESMVATVTNLDVHDLARTAKTYGMDHYFVITPIAAQRELVARICAHWTTGSSATRIPRRQEALSLVRPVSTIDDAVTMLGGRDQVEIWSTAARGMDLPVLSYAEACSRVDGPDPRSLLVLFGTSWGLAPAALASADALLAPIQPASPFNHLSVRAAAAIITDRLLARP